ncbi:MAG TPA: HD domain-containing protein [Fimbriiglobus sp.]
MLSSKSKIPVHALHEMPLGKRADTFVLIAERRPGKTRENKPYLVFTLKNLRRSVSAIVWGDAELYLLCDREWLPGLFLRIRGVLYEHETYGPQIAIEGARIAVPEKDAPDGFAEGDFIERSRFDSGKMFAELRSLAETEIAGTPLRSLVLKLLDTHAANLANLPAHPRAFFPYPGGWLEHSLSVTKNCLWLTDRYRVHYPELNPPLNRDLVAAGAVLHDIGRAVELTPHQPGQPVDYTIPGRLCGHLLLGRDLVRDAGRSIPDLNPELLALLEHLVYSHLALPEWGSPRLPAIPEVLILHHADDLDAKLEMYVRCLTRDTSPGPFTDRDPVLGKPLLKHRSV